jgi:RHS repeat-associated protein
VYYIREPGGELLARKDGSSLSYYHFDKLGSTRLLSDGSGNVTDKYSYDAYGALLAHDQYNGSVDQPYMYVGRIGYYTHYQDAEFGLLQLGVRFYDEDTGRFSQRDPVYQQKVSTFAYCNDRPSVMVDPSGMICHRCWRDLEPPWNVLPVQHSFIYCDVGVPGYDVLDPMIGMGGDSICSDFDRKYWSSVEIGDNYHLHCNELSDKLTDCLLKRIAKDTGKKCFGKYNPFTNNCQDYSQKMIDDCK